MARAKQEPSRLLVCIILGFVVVALVSLILGSLLEDGARDYAVGVFLTSTLMAFVATMVEIGARRGWPRWAVRLVIGVVGLGLLPLFGLLRRIFNF